ncbi:MAG TPA: YCF48-related protein [Candidatus Aquilonibacter sp.]|nr:YCF48-related protein [Candidatus Aquilonibacter sp.]
MQDVPKIVVMRLQGMAVTDPHPEADVLTAFAEQSLAQPERELVLGHIARCAECRQILESSLPAFESASVTTLSPTKMGWLRWPTLRWGLATAAVLALVSVGVLQYERHEKDEMASPASLNSQIAKQAPSGALEQSETVPTTNQEAQEQAQKPPFPSRETVARSSSTPAQNDFESPTGDSGMKARSEAGTVATARNRAPDQLIQKQLVQNQASGSPYQSYANSDVVKAKAAVPTDSTPALAPPNIPLQTAPSLMQRASPRWTINASGGLQRSFDAGKTWEDIQVNPDAGQPSGKPVFRVVAAMGPEVWAGGSGATLYHSSDSGTRWQQIFPLAAGSNPAGDITDISFSSPQQGRIATSAGEIWTTSDSGQTWRKQ